MQASFWDIYDSSKQQIISEDEQLQTEYNGFIQKEIKERIKAPGCLIDAEAFASGKAIEMIESKATAKVAGSGVNKSGAGSSKSGGGKGSSKQKSSGSNIKESGVS